MSSITQLPTPFFLRMNDCQAFESPKDQRNFTEIYIAAFREQAQKRVAVALQTQDAQVIYYDFTTREILDRDNWKNQPLKRKKA